MANKMAFLNPIKWEIAMIIKVIKLKPKAMGVIIKILANVFLVDELMTQLVEESSTEAKSMGYVAEEHFELFSQQYPNKPLE